MTITQPDPQEISYPANNLRAKIMQDREEYKSLLSELYTCQPPFTRDRSRDKENFAYELKQYVEMIGHCMIIGDSDILYKFGIVPIQNDVKVLVGHDDLNMYIDAFLVKFKDSNSEGERFYLAMLIRALKTVKGETVAPDMIRVD